MAETELELEPAREVERPARRAAPASEPVNPLGIAILSAASLVVISLAVEGVLGWLRAVRKERRRKGKGGAFISPAASSEALTKLLKRGGEGHAARGLPEGEYFRSPRQGDAGSRGSSAPPSPGRLTPSHSGLGELNGSRQQCVSQSRARGRSASHTHMLTSTLARRSLARRLPTILSAVELNPSLGPSGNDWAAAVAAGEPWTKTEPWASLWRASLEDAQP
jgi:hypothetical protein